MLNKGLTEWTVRAGVIFWFCFTGNQIVQGTVHMGEHEVTPIPSPPFNFRMN
jgi:hypothetical protein